MFDFYIFFISYVKKHFSVNRCTPHNSIFPIKQFHNHVQLLRVKNPLNNQTWHTNGWPQQKIPKFGFCTHTTGVITNGIIFRYCLPSLIVQWPAIIVYFQLLCLIVKLAYTPYAIIQLLISINNQRVKISNTAKFQSCRSNTCGMVDIKKNKKNIRYSLLNPAWKSAQRCICLNYLP